MRENEKSSIAQADEGPFARAFERLLGLQSFTSALAAALEPSDVVDAVVAHAIAAVGAAAATVFRIAPDGETLMLLGAHGFAEGVVAPYAPSFALDAQTPAGLAATTREPVWVESAEEFFERFPSHAEMKRRSGTEATAALPIVASGRVVGVIGLSFAERREFGGDDRAFLLTLAGQAGVALERAFLFARERAARDEAERANALLRASEERFRIISELTTDYAFGHYVEPDGSLRFDWVSDSMYRNLGITAESMNEHGWERNVHPDDVAVVRGHIARTYEGERDVVEYRILGADNAAHWVQSFSYPVRGEDGEVAYIYIAAQDVTARKRSELALQDSEERFRSTFEQAGTGIAHMTLEGCILRANRRMSELLGYSPEELTQMRSRELTHPDDVAAEERLLEDLLAGACASYSIEKRYVTAHGDIRWALESASIVRDEAGEPGYLLVLAEDISERKEAEHDRALLLEQAQRAQANAEAASRMKDEFLATVSHELRSPLNAVLGWSRMLASGKLDETASAHAVEVIERNASAQAQLIEDLLDVSRIITGRMRVRTDPVNLVTVVRATVDTVEPTASAKRVALEVRVDAERIAVLGDADRLRQVVWNLVSNAIKFTPADGRVTVRVERTDRDARVVVADTGKGINLDFLPYVFERFRQADGAATRRFGGLGLGLAIVRHMAELHGGSVDAESEGEGKGATFTVTLPLLAPEEAAASPTAVDVARDRASASVRLSGLSLVVVDDEQDTRELVATVLERHGADVRLAGSAAEAFDAVGERRPDALLCDIAMPGEDGYSLLRRLREWVAAAEMPAAALTAYVRPEDRDRALDAGFQLHVPKPIDPDDLVAAVCTLVGR